MGDMRVFLIYDRMAYVVGKCGKRREREGGVGNGVSVRAVWETARVAERR